MTNQEAIKGLNKLFSEHELTLPCTDSLEILHMSVVALERQIPNKPKIILDETKSFKRYYCPVCGRYFGNDKMRDHRFLFEEVYCQGENCGQSIDWSENHKD